MKNRLTIQRKRHEPFSQIKDRTSASAHFMSGSSSGPRALALAGHRARAGARAPHNKCAVFGKTCVARSAFSCFSRLAFLAGACLLFALAWPAQAQTPCPGSESCTGVVAQMVCPTPGTTLPGNDVPFTWCNANADYFLQMESIPGAHDIFFAFVPAQNFVHLINLPTNGATIYVTLWT